MTITLSRNDHSRLVTGSMRASMPMQIDARIRDSWQRCIGNALDPTRTRQVAVVSHSELRQRRALVDPVYAIARVEMAGLTRLLNAPVGVMLTDQQGIILSYCGDPRFADMAQHSGLREGALWSESAQGTNGMGTCLATRQPILIQEHEHYLFQNAALTCCAAPITDGRGQLIGALNISGNLRLCAAPTLALVMLAVQNIENRALLNAYQKHHVLRLHPHREFISSAGEGILAINDQGVIVAANRSALDWLHIAHHAQLVGQPLQKTLGLNMMQLQSLAHHPAQAQPLPPRESGSLCYGIVQSPSIAPLLATSKRQNRLAQAERDTLREVLDSCHWNVSLAARQLNMSRRTLHRKIKLHGLQRYSTLNS